MDKRPISANKIVVKVGTSTLMTADDQVNLQVIDQLCFTLANLVQQGKQVILVTSGAVGIGLSRLGLKRRPTDIPSQQALAAVGQSSLMALYRQRFLTYGQRIGQVLLTSDVLDYPTSMTNTKNTFDRLLAYGCIPVVNENDVVSVDELGHHTKFGDNDRLSALVTKLVDADLLVMLSDIDGFYSANPHTDSTAQLISHVPELTPQLWQLAGGSSTDYGTGGMTAKLRAAEIILQAGKAMVLAHGADPQIIAPIVAGEPIGTYFGTL